jgi:hypothetical protein|uniref:Uncharacterized protein n=1 Tax=Sipha flava TaxID=143950 RepID=A0A2S2PZ97_9HEMI
MDYGRVFIDRIRVYTAKRNVSSRKIVKYRDEIRTVDAWKNNGNPRRSGDEIGTIFNNKANTTGRLMARTKYCRRDAKRSFPMQRFLRDTSFEIRYDINNSGLFAAGSDLAKSNTSLRICVRISSDLPAVR